MNGKRLQSNGWLCIVTTNFSIACVRNNGLIGTSLLTITNDPRGMDSLPTRQIMVPERKAYLRLEPTRTLMALNTAERRLVVSYIQLVGIWIIGFLPRPLRTLNSPAGLEKRLVGLRALTRMTTFLRPFWFFSTLGCTFLNANADHPL